MRLNARRLRLTGMGLCVLASTRVGPLYAQGHSDDARRTSATIAVSDTFPYHNADAVLVRRVNSSPHDVLLIDSRKLDAAMVEHGVHMIQAVRQRMGVLPTEDVLLRVDVPKVRRRYSQHREDSERWAQILRKVPTSEVAKMGSLRSIEISLLP